MKGIMIKDDAEAWIAFPQYHHTIFNKLWLAETMGYNCGPAGLPIPANGMYVIRPIYNLDGMSKDSYISFFCAGSDNLHPGTFWCECFEGPHVSVDYQVNWYTRKPSCLWSEVVMGVKAEGSTRKFTRWLKKPSDSFVYGTSLPPKLIPHLEDFGGVFNIEYIGENPIEIHLRGSQDFKKFGHRNITDLRLVWASDLQGKAPMQDMVGYKLLEANVPAYPYVEDYIVYTYGK